MKQYKYITASLNSKGELEVRAYKELKPFIVLLDDKYAKHIYEGEMLIWQSSAEVFNPASSIDLYNINTEIKIRWDKLGKKEEIDATDFIYIFNGFAFYKFPKDQPEQTDGESQEQPDTILIIDHAIAELKTCYKRIGYINSNVLCALEDLNKRLKAAELNQNS